MKSNILLMSLVSALVLIAGAGSAAAAHFSNEAPAIEAPSVEVPPTRAPDEKIAQQTATVDSADDEVWPATDPRMIQLSPDPEDLKYASPLEHELCPTNDCGLILVNE